MDQLTNTLKAIIDFFNVPLWGATQGDYVMALFYVTFFFIMRGFLVSLILKSFNGLMRKVSISWDKSYSEPIRKPLRWLFLIIGISLAILAIPGKATHSYAVVTTFKIAIILLVAYTLMHLEGLFHFMFKGLESRMNMSRSQLLQQFSLRIYRFVLVIMTIAIVLNQIGIDVGAMIAGLGLAGLAFALAAKDTLSNVFAGVTMIIDKPFDVGDRVLSQGIDGVVEDINFRSTRIRTLEQEYVTLPNSKIAGDAIVNFTRRDTRKCSFVLGFVYGTPIASLERFIQGIEQIIKEDKKVDTDSVIVKLKGFGSSGIEVMVHYLTLESGWEGYLTINEKINIKILEMIEDLGMSLAYPSTSVYFENSLIHRSEQGYDQNNIMV